MSNVFGQMSFNVLTEVESANEKLALLQANYRLNPERFVGYELVGITSKGERVKINVCDCTEAKFDEFVEM